VQIADNLEEIHESELEAKKLATLQVNEPHEFVLTIGIAQVDNL
jgi:hypothetical protein